VNLDEVRVANLRLRDAFADFLSAGTDQASASKLCANAVTSKSLNPRDALDAVVILSGAEGDKKLAGDPNADPLLAELQLS
jgi:hypothetical protein